MNLARKDFYLYLFAFFTMFFLLHWNGFLSPLYFWALKAYGEPSDPYSQMMFAFLSSIAIFTAIAIVYELLKATLGPDNSSQ